MTKLEEACWSTIASGELLKKNLELIIKNPSESPQAKQWAKECLHRYPEGVNDLISKARDESEKSTLKDTEPEANDSVADKYVPCSLNTLKEVYDIGVEFGYELGCYEGK